MSTQKLKILVVDDDSFVRSMIEAILDSGGYRVSTAESGEHAFTILKDDTNFDLIISDMNMPEMNGLEFMTKLHGSKLDIPFMILTGNSEISVAIDAMNNGADRYLLKDENIQDTILVSVEKVLEKHQLKKKNIQLMKDLAEKNAELERLAFLDGLTGVANRRYFDEIIGREWGRAGRSNTSLAVVMIDIDFFKLFNDNYGHQQGDDCLKKVAKSLSGSLRRSADFLARYGGEEFVATLPNSDLSGASVVAKNMHANVAQLNIPHASSEVSDHVTVSLGIACAIPKPKADFSELISLADKALYDSKQNGRNQTKIVTSD